MRRCPMSTRHIYLFLLMICIFHDHGRSCYSTSLFECEYAYHCCCRRRFPATAIPARHPFAGILRSAGQESIPARFVRPILGLYACDAGLGTLQLPTLLSIADHAFRTIQHDKLRRMRSPARLPRKLDLLASHCPR
ncbi:hypothetical protein HII31_06587 [Pseudocercospora fuligena]|uniref:Secreted protein n=1 Tax=Pseudocercospora fuligena TaxID=685502 RepID=A0A8H6RLD9_9PEZI|nr:hypothetical protein HII31_06587 [Pseudocercospora fuligena]